MSDYSLSVVYGLVNIGITAVVFLILPKLWRPELPFGVTVRFEGSEEARRRALRYWRKSILLLTAAAAVAVVALARRVRNMENLRGLSLPYGVLAIYFFTRARKILLPLALPPEGGVKAAIRPRRYRDYLNPWWEVLPLAIWLLGISAILWTLYQNPVPVGKSANPVDYAPLLGWIFFAWVIFTQFGFYAFLLLFSILIPRAKQSIGRGDPKVCIAASDAFRKVWIRYFYVFRVFWVIDAIIFLGLTASFGRWRFPDLLWTLCISYVNVSFVGLVSAAVIIALRYGQGGWKWAVRQGLVDKDTAAAVLNGDGMEDRHWKFGMFFFNPADPSILVETRVGIGWSFNFGNGWVLAFFVLFLAYMLLPVLLLPYFIE
ncbi:MAG: DUF5808 domain-containing protein [Planctomycetota bacterium]